MSGTCLEASANSKDVFLVSQSALQGTVRPCRYTMIQDENNLSTDEFQRIGKVSLNCRQRTLALTLCIVYGLCFAYARATRSVGLVPPIYYANQACERAKISLRTFNGQTVLPEPHGELELRPVGSPC